MRVEQEQKVTEDARRYAEQDAAAQRYATEVLQVNNFIYWPVKTTEYLILNLALSRKNMKQRVLPLLKWRRGRLWQNQCWRQLCNTNVVKLKHNLHRGITRMRK